MVNYYEELKLDREKSAEEIKAELARLEGIWKRREITNPEKATKMLSVIIEARTVFESEHSRKEYDRELDKECVSDMPAEEKRAQQMKKWLDQATNFFNEKEYDLARTALDRAALYVPPECDDPEYFSIAAQIYKRCGSFDDAISNINKAIILDPDYAYYYLEKGDIFIQIAFAYGKNSDMTKFSDNISRGKSTLNTAIAKAKFSNDNDVEATAMGVLAFLWNNTDPKDHNKAKELAYEALSIGTDQWGNSQKIISDEQEKQRRINEQELARLEESYVKALGMMKSGMYEDAAKLFRELGNYKDSAELADRCSDEKIISENRRKDSIYNSAKDYMNKKGIDYTRTAYSQFKSIPGWKDSDELAAQCKRMIEKYERENPSRSAPPMTSPTSSQSQLRSQPVTPPKPEYEPASKQALWRLHGQCQYCGGEFTGIIKKTCRDCGNVKDY